MTAFFGIVLIALVGFASLVADAGLLYAERRHLQNTVDAAALAGAREFLYDGWTESDVITVVETWAASNGVPATELTVTVGTKLLPAGELPTVTVQAQREVGLMFAGVLGIDQMPVGVSAVAGVTPMRPLKIWPWSINTDTYEDLLEYQDQHGETYLKLSSQQNQSGNFLPLAFNNSQGATRYEEFIKFGFYGPLPVQVPPNTWWVETQTGNMVGKTESGVDYLLDQEASNPCALQGNDIRCPLIGLVPVVTKATWDAANGSSTPQAVVHFAIFMVDRLDSDPNAPSGGQGHQVVWGEFRESAIAVGPTDPDSDIALYGVRLWN